MDTMDIHISLFEKIFSVFMMLQLTHFIGDFSWQDKKSIDAKKYSTFLTPIFTHACYHGILVGLVLTLFQFSLEVIILGLIFETFSHFVIDTVKGFINRISTDFINPTKQSYWFIFGLDQFAHQCIKIAIVYWIVYKQIFVNFNIFS